MRLIDADRLEKWAHEFYPNNKEFASAIRNAPTVPAVVLPCNVGDTVWWFTGRKILKCKVGRFQIAKYGVAMTLRTGNVIHGLFPCDLIGTSLFFTSEEAEAELERRKAE